MVLISIQCSQISSGFFLNIFDSETLIQPSTIGRDEGVGQREG